MPGPRISIIAAVASNGVIGRDGGMPWSLSSDLGRFKALTLGKPVIMGRKTFQSIGRPLKDRLNIVISGRLADPPEGVLVAPDLDAALAIALGAGGDEVMIAGGGAVYADAMPRADRLYITHVDAAPAGDVAFPEIDPAVWRVVSAEPTPAGPKDSAATTFVVYERSDGAASR